MTMLIWRRGALLACLTLLLAAVAAPAQNTTARRIQLPGHSIQGGGGGHVRTYGGTVNATGGIQGH